MHSEKDCDCIIGIGSGVINDICKIVSSTAKIKYISVATAPSMDGYASPSSSMERDGFKISLDSTFAYAVIGDLDILCKAPYRMLCAGLGDMLAKYISLCEWKISSIINGEYFCPDVYEIMKTALNKCVENAHAFSQREPQAVKAVTEGLVIAGIAMQYAGVSRPASGTEHYYSHIWDMRSLAFGTKADFHGIQCGIATLSTLKIYEKIKSVKPSREKALEAVNKFDLQKHNEELREFIGSAAEIMIEQEKKERKYDPALHAERLEKIIEKWDEIISVINELPSYDEIYSLMKSISAPVSAQELSATPEEEKMTFLFTKDIRDKYISSRLIWDLGIEEL
ncbi:MAG: iron-containing alcohol dehydrogenase, partial [Clostridia bacterium]|nr:iron-containing alcohol dehydrogenase [Clostridia bacterium]